MPAGREIKVSEVEDQITIRQQALSEEVAAAVLRLFKISVISTITLTVLLASVDAAFIYNGTIEARDRLVTENVVMAIIGASIVQVGAAAIAIVYSLFRRSGRAGGTSPGMDEEQA